MVGTTITFIIRGCSERAEYIDSLRQRLPAASVVFDRERDAMETFCRALCEAGTRPAVHMEDDVILAEGFAQKIEAVIDAHRDTPIQFFSLRPRDLIQGSRLEPGRSFMMGQCFYLPAGMSADLLRYRDEWPRITEHPTGLDTMVSDYLHKHRLKYWLHVPSLVQHRKCVSLINPRRSKYRQSPSFETGI